MSYRREAKILDRTWILVADRAQARVFRARWPELEQWEELQQLDHPAGAAKWDEVLTDRPGRFAGYGSIRQSGEPQTDLRHKTGREFALQLAEILERGRTQLQFGRLIIVAPALMLGILRDQLSDPLAKTVALEVCKEMSEAPVSDLMEQISAELQRQQVAHNGHART